MNESKFTLQREYSIDKVLMFLKILTEMGRAMDICTTEG